MPPKNNPGERPKSKIMAASTGQAPKGKQIVRTSPPPERDMRAIYLRPGAKRSAE